ncbi:MAG: hypothetical protein ACFFB5_10495 [Promethearchaeota archaeon]
MTSTESVPLKQAPLFVKKLDGLGYLGNWHQVRGTIYITLQNLPGAILRSLTISKKRIGVAENIWVFSSHLPIINPKIMIEKREYFRNLFQRLKGEECMLEWEGIISRKMQWRKNPQLSKFFSKMDKKPSNLLMNTLIAESRISDLTKKLKPDRIIISVSGGVIPPPIEGAKFEYYSKRQSDLFNNPIECTWYTQIKKQFYLTRRISKALEYILLLLDKIMEQQLRVTRKISEELI